MSFPRFRSLVLCAAMSGMVVTPVVVLAQTTQTPSAGAQDSNAPVTSKGQEDALKNEEKANKQRAKAAKEQRKALRAQEKAAKADKKAGDAQPSASSTPQ
jgi:hypothetical protein